MGLLEQGGTLGARAALSDLAGDVTWLLNETATAWQRGYDSGWADNEDGGDEYGSSPNPYVNARRPAPPERSDA